MLDDGRAVEGFVVRCKRGHGELEKDFFFKVKYDDPYLMFREWRELTKKILTKSGAKDGLRFTYKLSKEYVDWLQDSMKQHPQWFVDYNKGRGIIHVRNAFIEWWQSSHQGVNIVTLSAERMRGTKAKRLVIDLDEDVERETAPALIKTTRPAQAPQVVLAPIATIGCGKTTLAIALHELFGWAHVQNDNITAKKAAPVFYKQLVDNLKKSRVIIADKNNHLGMHRKGITDAVRKAYPKAYIIALNFIPTNDPEARNELFQLTRDRVVNRGENHQSLTPNKSMDFMGIMRRFQNDFVPVSFDNADDAGLDEIIQIDPAEELRVKIQQVADIVCPLVGTSADISDHDLERAMHAALTYTPLVSKDAGSQRAAYWGLSVGTDVIQLCRDYFDVHPDVDQGYFLELLAGGRITADRLHVTLIHIKETKDSEIIRAKWKRLETHAKVEAVMHASGLVWNGRCMALAVTAIEPSWIWETRATLEPVSHITLGTTDATIKPVEAKSLVESAWTSPASGTVVIRFPQPWTIRGKLTGYTV
jgi:tRNA ligase